MCPAGSIDFCTFFRLLPRLLVFDRANTIEMAFRMCSRRGVACCLNKLILDEKDLGYIVEQRQEATFASITRQSRTWSAECFRSYECSLDAF